MSKEVSIARGRALRLERIKVGMSVADMAKKIGCNRNALYANEEGHVKLSDARATQIAAALGVPVEKLLPDIPLFARGTEMGDFKQGLSVSGEVVVYISVQGRDIDTKTSLRISSANDVRILVGEKEIYKINVQ